MYIRLNGKTIIIDYFKYERDWVVRSRRNKKKDYEMIYIYVVNRKESKPVMLIRMRIF